MLAFSVVSATEHPCSRDPAVGARQWEQEAAC